MRTPTKIAGLALAVLLLSGCLPQQPTATDPPEASSTPVFDSEEEALAAATAAYTAYLAMSDQIAADGGVNPERLAPLVTEDQQGDVVNSFKAYAEDGLRAVGESAFDTVTIAQFENGEKGAASIDLYLCLDVSDVQVLNAAGEVKTPPERTDRLPLQVGFDANHSGSHVLLLARSESWTGENFCG
ncbi:MAG: hypothetical protein H7226_02145 [Salinibacterium sp.]|nr:hypothetical protein [Salinibacterium sp.]